MEKKFNLLLRSYLNESTIAQSTVERYGGGHINETYLVTHSGNGEKRSPGFSFK